MKKNEFMRLVETLAMPDVMTNIFDSIVEIEAGKRYVYVAITGKDKAQIAVFLDIAHRGNDAQVRVASLLCGYYDIDEVLNVKPHVINNRVNVWYSETGGIANDLDKAFWREMRRRAELDVATIIGAIKSNSVSSHLQ